MTTVQKIKDLTKRNLVTLHNMIKEKRDSASIQEISKWYETLYMYLRTHNLVLEEHEDENVAEVLEDSILFLLELSEKEPSLESIKKIVSIMNPFVTMYQSLKG